MPLSSYPTDVANAKDFEVLDDLQEQFANEDVLFDMWLADIEKAQTVDNQEYVVHVCGKGRWAQMQALQRNFTWPDFGSHQVFGRITATMGGTTQKSPTEYRLRETHGGA